MRKILRKIILWALAGAPEAKHDAEGMDRVIRDMKSQG